MSSTKQAIITREHEPEAKLLVLYKDLKTYGKDFYDFYRRAKNEGVEYIKGKLAEVYEDPATKNLLVTYEDLESGEINELEVELLVLSVPLIPNQKIKRLSKALKIEFDQQTGFFKVSDPVTGPLESSAPGIYLCGGALGPTDISEAVTQAIAASMKAVSKVVEERAQVQHNMAVDPKGVTQDGTRQ